MNKIFTIADLRRVLTILAFSFCIQFTNAQCPPAGPGGTTYTQDDLGDIINGTIVLAAGDVVCVSAWPPTAGTYTSGGNFGGVDHVSTGNPGYTWPAGTTLYVQGSAGEIGFFGALAGVGDPGCTPPNADKSVIAVEDANGAAIRIQGTLGICNSALYANNYTDAFLINGAFDIFSAFGCNANPLNCQAGVPSDLSAPPAEDCSTAGDEDGDGFADCDDSDCNRFAGLLQNASLEILDACNIGGSNFNSVVQNWDNASGTAEAFFYPGSGCTGQEITDLFPSSNTLDPRDGFVYAGLHSGGAFVQEVVIQSLNASLTVSTTYTLSASSAKIQAPLSGQSVFDNTDISPVKYYGYNSATVGAIDFTNDTTIDNSSGVDLLGTGNPLVLPNAMNEAIWVDSDITFTATEAYDSFIVVPTGFNNYIAFDNLSLEVLPGTVTVTGTASCGNPLTINPNGIVAGDTYQWYKDGVAIAGETGLTFMPMPGDGPGEYSATIIQASGCESSQFGFVSIDCTDTDGDGVPDLTDLDDDNDGILDSVECPIFPIDFTGAPAYTTPQSFGDTTITIARVDGLNGSAATNGNADGDIRLGESTSTPGTYLDGDQVTFTATSGQAKFLLSNQTQTIAGFNGPNGDQIYLEAIGGFVINDPDNQLAIVSQTATTVVFEPTSLIAAGTGTWEISTVDYVTSFIIQADGDNGTAVNIRIMPFADSDGDGIQDCFDLDSDNDGCPDFVEGGGTFTEAANGVTAQGTVSSGTGSTVDTNLGNTVQDTNPAGADYGVPTVAGTGQAIGSSQNSGIENCTDSDADGVADSADLDDDNDGILDTDEDACSTDTASYNNNWTYQSWTTVGPTSIAQDAGFTFAQAGLVANGDGTFTFDGTTVGVDNVADASGSFSNTIAGAANTQNAAAGVTDLDSSASNGLGEVSEMTTYSVFTPGAAVTFDLVDDIANDTFAYAVLDTNGNVLASGNPGYGTAVRTETISFTAPANGAIEIKVWYYDPSGVYSIPQVEATPDPPGIVVNSSLPCTFDFDNDGVINSLDLDSDNDGCPDFVEGGGTFTEAANGVAQGGTLSDGNGDAVTTNLGNTVGTTAGVDEGVPTVAGTGQSIGFSQNDTINACADTDGDGVADLVDLDNDNDGILDTDEDVCDPQQTIVTATIAAGTGDPQVYTAASGATVTIENLTDDVVTNDAGLGYRLGSASATIDRDYSMTFSAPVSAIAFDLSFVNNNIDGQEALRDFAINNGGNLVITHTDTSTGVATTFIDGVFSAATGGAEASTSGILQFVSDVPFTQFTFTFDFVSNNGGGGVNNTFGIMLGEICILADTDGDGLIDSRDTDSDADGCSDANEAYADANADGGDGGVYNPGNTATEPLTLGDGTINADGTVVAASYATGVVAAVTDDTDAMTCAVEDNDNVDAAIENGAPNGGDGNNDGLMDSEQPNVASIPDGTGTQYVTLEVITNGNGDCTQITNMVIEQETDLVSLDDDFSYPLGLVDFTLDCLNPGESATVKFYWYGIDNLAALDAYRKFGPPVPGGDVPTTGVYTSTIAGITSAIENINGTDVYTVTYDITDGILGDETAQDSQVVDPTGPAIAAVGPMAGCIEIGAATTVSATGTTGNPQSFGAGANQWSIENTTDATVANFANQGYRIGSDNAIINRDYTITLNQPADEVLLDLSFFNNDVSGNEQLGNFAVDAGTIAINWTDQSTTSSVVYNTGTGNLEPAAGASGAGSRGVLSISSDMPFTTITMTYTSVSGNPFGIIFSEMAFYDCSATPMAGCTNILFILDDSGSVNPTERVAMTASVQALADEIETINPSVQIGVIQYSFDNGSPDNYVIETGFVSNPTIVNVNLAGVGDFLPSAIAEMELDGLFSGGGQFENTTGIFIFTDGFVEITPLSASGSVLSQPAGGAAGGAASTGYQEYVDLSASLGGIPITVYRAVPGTDVSAAGIEQGGGILIEGIDADFSLSTTEIEDLATSLMCTAATCTISSVVYTSNNDCNSGTDTYTADVTVTFTDAPASGTLDVTFNGGSGSISAPFISPATVTVMGITADGTSGNVSASFSADATCSDTITATAEASCFAPLDTDMDGILDAADLDDDNDGILDTDEMDCSPGFVALGQTFSSTAVSGTVANTFAYGSADITLGYELVGTNPGTTPAWGSGVSNQNNVTIGPDGQYANFQPNNTDFPLGDVAVYTLDFNNGPVYNLEFKWGGIDIQDRLDIVAMSGGTNIPVTITDINLGGNLTFLGPQSVVSTAGGSSAPDNSIQIQIDGPVDQVVVTVGKQNGNSGNATTQLYEMIYCVPADSDGDGIFDHLDVDSDNDGCADAIEAAGAFTATDLDADDSLGDTVDADGVPTVAAGGQATTSAVTNALQNACEDNDMDGVPDYADLDDDNDGILDTDEGCAGWSAVDFGAGGATTNGVTVGAAGFNGSVATNAGLLVFDNPTFTFGTTAPLQQNNFNYNVSGGGIIRDDITWSYTGANVVEVFLHINSLDQMEFQFDRSLPGNADVDVALASGNDFQVIDDGTLFRVFDPNISPPSTNTDSSVADEQLDGANGLSADFTIRFTLRNGATGISSFITSFVEVATTSNASDGGQYAMEVNVASDSDGDGIIDCLDTDSDNDGCADAIEAAGAFTAADLDADDSLGDTVDADGVPTVAAGGQATTSAVTNALQNACEDNDMDGVPDYADLDDDNDGILDSVECDFLTDFAGATTSATNATFTINGVNAALERNDPSSFIVVNGTTLVIANSGASSDWYFDLDNAFTSATIAISDLDSDINEFINGFSARDMSGAVLSPVTPISVTGDLIIVGNEVRSNAINGSGTITFTGLPAGTAQLLFSLTNDDLVTNPSIDLVIETIGVRIDSDADGISDCFDTDSDNDGCPDAIEAAGTFTAADLDGDDSLGDTVDADGVPTVASGGQATTPAVTDAMINACASISLEKESAVVDSNGNGITDEGDTILYTFTITNTGTIDLASISVTDPNAIVTPTTTINLAAGASDNTTYSGTYVITAADITAGNVTNVATVTGGTAGGQIVTDTSDDPNNPTDNDTNGDGEPDDPTVTDLSQPLLDITKTATVVDTNGNGMTDAGDTINYVFVVTNTGNVDLTGISVTDPNATVSPTTTIDLIAGASDTSTYTAVYVLTQVDVDAGGFTNQATTSAPDPNNPTGPPVTDDSDDPADTTDTDPNNDGSPDDPTVTTIAPDPDISVTKTGTFNDENGDGNAQVGETISYVFDVTNTGNVTLSGITVTDASVTVSGGPIDLASGANDNTTFTATYTITQADIDAGSVTNTASVKGDDPNGTTVFDNSDDPTDTTDVDPDGDGDPDDPTVTDLGQDSDISVTKTGTLDDTNGNGFPDVGETINYMFEVTNTGNTTLTNIMITDALATVLGGPIDLAPGAGNNTAFTASYVITQADIDNGSFTNTATATGDDPDGNPVTDVSDDPNNPTDDDPNNDGDPDDPTTTALDANPSLRITKTGAFIDGNGDGLAQPGETIQYIFDVTNTGNVTLTNITVTDPLVTVSGGPLATLAPGQTDSTTFTALYTLVQADIDAGVVTNTATASGDDPDGNPVTDDSDDPTTVDPDDPTDTTLARDPRIALFKTGTFNDESGDGIPQAGETVTYIFDVRNVGNVTLVDVVITDPLVTVNGGPLASLAPLGIDNTTFTGDYTITQADIDSGSITNTATVTSEDTLGGVVTDVSDFSDDPDNTADIDLNGDGDPDDPTVTTLLADPSIELTKASTFNDESGDGLAQVGETISYVFEVTNTGNVTLTGIAITDPLVTVSGGPIDLAPTASDNTTFTATYTITQADIDNGSFTNTATATGDDPNGDPVTDDSDDPNNPTDSDTNGDGDPDDPTVTTLPGDPDISILKTATFNDESGDGIPQVGETIVYTFTVTNTGVTTLTNVTVTDPLVTVSGGPLATMAPGAVDTTSFTATYTITQADIDAGSITNTATATGEDPNGGPVTDASDDPNNPTDDDPNGDGDPDDPTVTNLPADPEITLAKIGTFNDANGDGIAQVGETISYAFEVTNTGNVTVTGITITDPLVAVNGGPIDLASGESDSTTFTATYTLTLADVNAGGVTNQATAAGQDPDGNPVTDDSDDPTTVAGDDPTETPLTQSPELSLTKTSNFNDENGDGIFQAGETISYTFTVSNTGNVTLTGVTITDPLVTVTGGPVDLDPGDMDTSTFTATYTVTQADIDAGNVTNTATATGNDPDSNPVSDNSDDPNDPTNTDDNSDGDPDDPTVTSITADPSISITKTGTFNDENGDGIAQAGETISYVFDVSNTGNVTLTGIAVTDPNVTVAGGPIDLAPGVNDNTTFTATYTITQADVDAGSITNTATATGNDPNGDPVTDDSDDPNNPTDDDPNGDGDPDDPTVTDLGQDPDISVTKVGTLNDANGNGFPDAGETINYTFEVINTGNTTLTGITITDALATVLGGPIDLAPGATNAVAFTASYVITQADIDSGSFTNTATVTGNDPDGNPVTDVSDDPNNPTDDDPNGDGDPDDPTVTNLDTDPSIRITKTGVFIDTNGDGLAQAGETITYTFDVTNTGNVSLTGVTVTDPLIPVTGGPIDLAPGVTDSSTFTATYILTQADVDTGNVTNVATASGDDPDGNPVTDDSDDPTTVDPDDPTVTTLARDPKISLFKTANFNDENGDGIPQAGETVTYIFDVRNTGNVTLTDVVITDPLVTVMGGPLATMPPGTIDNSTFTGTYTILQADIDAGSITNTATAIGEDTDGGIVTDVSDFSDDPDNPVNEDLNGDGDPDDPTVTDLMMDPAISILKAAIFNDENGDGFGQAGETISYTFTVENTGNVSLTGVTVTDALVTVVGGPVDLLPGVVDTTTFTATYTLTQADVDNGGVTNTAVASGDDPNGDPVTDDSDDPNNTTDTDNNGDGDPDDPTDTTLPGDPDISILKIATFNDEDGDGIPQVGETITYNFEVINTGNVTLTDISVTDPNVTVSGGPIDLGPGTTDTTTFFANYIITQADIDAGSITNSATVTGEDPNGDPVTDDSDDPNNPTDDDPDGDGDPDDATVTTLPADPEITLNKIGTFNDVNGDGIAQVGETISYTFEVINTGNVTVTGITITDPLVAVNGGPIDLASGESDATTFTATYTLTLADVNAGNVLNQATASGQDPDGNPVTDDSDDPTTVDPDDPTDTPLTQSPELSLTKTSVFNDENGDGVFQAGETVSYVFNVRNTGNVTITDITITDPLVTVNGGPIDLDPGDADNTTFTATYVITQADIDAGSITNSATAEGQDPDGNPVIDISDDPNDPTNTDDNGDGDPDDDTVTTIDQEDSMSVTKESLVAGYTSVGDIITYEIVVTNTGNTTLSNIVITDANATVTGGSPIATLLPGASATVTAEHVVVLADITAGSVINTAVADGQDPDGNPVTDNSDDPNNPKDFDDNNDGEPDDPTITGLDSDMDGIPDSVDLDDDNDGITDVEEQNGDPLLDTDGDGIIDSLDTDSDGDGVNDVVEAGHGEMDTDGDGRLDGTVGTDGIPDDVQDDPDGGDVNYTPEDSDGDGVDDFQDVDDDGDGVNTIDENPNPDGDGDPNTGDTQDSDGDGIPDYLDTDDDGDNIPTLDENPNPDGDGDPNTGDTQDSDGDGIPDYLDMDDDGDGVDTAEEDYDGDDDPQDQDSDGDGIPDYLDVDDDGDGVDTEFEGPDPDTDGDPNTGDTQDSDGDGIPDYLDQDDDGDNIPTDEENPDPDGDGDPNTGDTQDSDGDGVPDYLDMDDDGDGVDTAEEDYDGNDDPQDQDSDGDGIPDYLDQDDDGDGVDTEFEGPDPDTDGDPNTGDTQDSDGDGIPDYLDQDDDGDNIPTLDENPDPDGDGDPNTGDTQDSDGDGIPDYLDMDDDGDGVDTAEEDYDGNDDPQDQDSDGDGIPDYLDVDDDGDGVDTEFEGPDPDDDGDPNTGDTQDSDGDGIPDYLDTDDDGDGIDTIDEGPDPDGDGDPNTGDTLDTDGDGTPDYLDADDTDGDGIPDVTDIDDDNDGILDVDEGSDPNGDGLTDDAIDTDGDGIPDYLDIDADNDGIPDNVEGQDTVDYIEPSGNDDDGNGLDDAYEETPGSGDGVDPEDTDGDGTPDYIDEDSDNDGVDDTIEAFDLDNDGEPDIIISGDDEDMDGLDDAFEGGDTDDGYDVNDELDNGSDDTENSDGTDDVDYRDEDDDNDGVLTEDEIDPDGDGNGPDDTDGDGTPDYLDIDDDGDGVDTAEELDPDNDGNGPDDTDGDGTPDYLDIDDDDDGILTEDENPDPDGDGNPEDSFDSDGDGTPDYLEPNEEDPNAEDDLEVFNVVTPNDDGDHDTFTIRNIESFPDNQMRIYNRWGVLVYETRGYGQNDRYFRGISEGRVTVRQKEELPVGTYYYVLDYTANGVNKSRAGYLYINR